MPPLILIVGLITTFAGYQMDTAPSGTHNLGLLQNQMMTVHTGLALMIIAAIRWDRVAPVSAQPRTVVSEDGTYDVPVIDPDVERDNKRWLYGMLAVFVAIIVYVVVWGKG